MTKCPMLPIECSVGLALVPPFGFFVVPTVQQAWCEDECLKICKSKFLILTLLMINPAYDQPTPVSMNVCSIEYCPYEKLFVATRFSSWACTLTSFWNLEICTVAWPLSVTNCALVLFGCPGSRAFGRPFVITSFLIDRGVVTQKWSQQI